MRKTFWAILAISFLLDSCHGHGILLSPVGRSSIWRDSQFAHLNPPENWNDSELFCGGFFDQYYQNGGRCGPCGDNWSDRVPRENENTGHYGRGIVAANYARGQTINVLVDVTAAHWGHFEFRICPLSSASQVETNECFTHLLQLSNGSGHKFAIGGETGMYTISLRLPSTLVCNRCVFQWHYRTGNTWGNCGNGTEGLGCGDQEIFRSCADISIS